MKFSKHELKSFFHTDPVTDFAVCIDNLHESIQQLGIYMALIT